MNIRLTIVPVALSALLNCTSAFANDCVAMLPYLRDIRTSASSASSSEQAAQMYRSMLQTMRQQTDAESAGGGASYGLAKADANYAANRSELEYHLASSESASSSAKASSEWLQSYANTLAAGATRLVGDCLRQRGVEYRFVIGADGRTFSIKATFAKPSDQIKEVRVQQVVHGDNVSCDKDNFKTIGSGERILVCKRLQPGPDTILIATDYFTDLSTEFQVPDVRPRYRLVTKTLPLTFCGAPNCANDMSRQFAWSPRSHQPLSCNLFDLKAMNLLRDGDFLERGQRFPLELVASRRGSWQDIYQDQQQSKALSSSVIQLCGTRAEPFDAWPNLYFEVRTQYRYLERLR